MLIDHDRIQYFLTEIVQETSDLRSLLLHPDEDIRTSPHLMKSCKYSIIVITEAIANTLQHLLAKQYKTPVSGYTEIINKSIELHLISAELSGKLQPFFRFRNMLVHHYWRVEDQIFLQNLREGIGDFAQFAKEMRKLISQ